MRKLDLIKAVSVMTAINRYKCILKQYARLFETTTISKNMVEHKEFRKLVEILDARAPHPSRSTVDKEIHLLWEQTQGRMRLVLSRMKVVALTIGNKLVTCKMFCAPDISRVIL